MVEAINVIIGREIIILNLVPFIMKKPKYLTITSILSLIILFLLLYLK